MKISFLFLLFINICFAQEGDLLRKCDLEKMKWNGIPFDKNLNILPECRPQILYSWVRSAESLNMDDYKLPKRGRAWFFRTPLGSSLYGSFSFRVKLKPDVKFKHQDYDEDYASCNYSDAEKKESVYVRTDSKIGFSEYMICDQDVVESWSFGMPEHLEEMKREKQLIKDKGNKAVDGMLNPATAKIGQCKTCFSGYTTADNRNDGTERTIDSLIEKMSKFVSNKRGKVFNLAKKTAYTEGKEVAAHFHTLLVLPFHKNSNYNPSSNYSSLKVTEAHANDQNVKDKVASYCKRSSKCTYKIADKFLAIGGTITSFKLEWTCCDPLNDKCVNKHTLDLNHKSLEGKSFEFGCDEMGALVSSDVSSLQGPKLAPPAAKVDTQIRIIEAKANKIDVAVSISSFCLSKKPCSYKIGKSYLNSSIDIKALKIRWSCVDKVTLAEVVKTQNTINNTENKNLEGTKFEMNCDDFGSPQFKALSGAKMTSADSSLVD